MSSLCSKAKLKQILGKQQWQNSLWTLSLQSNVCGAKEGTIIRTKLHRKITYYKKFRGKLNGVGLRSMDEGSHCETEKSLEVLLERRPLSRVEGDRVWSYMSIWELRSSKANSRIWMHYCWKMWTVVIGVVQEKDAFFMFVNEREYIYGYIISLWELIL